MDYETFSYNNIVSHFHKPIPKMKLETPNKHHWQEALALASLIDDEKKLGDCQFDLLKQYYVATCVAVFGKLRRLPLLGRGPEWLHRAVHLQTGGPHGRRQRRRLSGCSGHRIRQRRLTTSSSSST
jgi:hypothetical protein